MIEQPKLTVAGERLYAGRRKSMPTMPVDVLDITEVKPKVSSEASRSSEKKNIPSSPEVRKHREHESRRTLLAPELRRHADKTEAEGLFKRKERKGIVSELPRNTFEMAKESLFSENEQDQIFGVMALELDEHTKNRPISEWRPMQRALELADWEQYTRDRNLEKETSELKKRKKEGKATQEELDCMYNMRLAIMGIKKELSEGLSQRKNTEVVLDGKKEKVSELQIVTDPEVREAYFKKIDGLDATTIKTKEIKEAFDTLIERTKPDAATLKPAELDAMRQEWHKLEERFKDSSDSEGLQALAIAREKIADLRKRKEPVGRREEPPQAVRKTNVSHAESSSHKEEPPRETNPQIKSTQEETRLLREIIKPGMTDSQIIEVAVDKGMNPERAEKLVRVGHDMSRAEAERRNDQRAAKLASFDNDEEAAEYLSNQVRRDQESTGKTRLEAIDDLNERHGAWRADSDADPERRKKKLETELGKAEVEAMDAWHAEKEKMESLVDRVDKEGNVEEGAKTKLKVDEKNDSDWRIYGWSAQDKKEVIDKLFDLELLGDKRKDRENAHCVVKTLLLNGYSGKEAIAFLTKCKDPKVGVGGLLKEFMHDEDVWEAFGQGDAFFETNRHEYESSEVKDIENLGWQLSFIYGNSGFAEDGDHPAWERKLLMVDDQKRKVAEVDGQWYAVNSKGEIIDKNPVDRVKYELHEVANRGNIILAIRKRVNWEQYKDENGKWNVFSLKLPDKRGFVQVSIESMLDAKDSAFSGSKKEAVPKWLLEEKAKDHTKITESERERFLHKTVKEDYKDVAEVIEMEGYFVTMIRQMHLSYIENYTNEEELAKNMNALLSKSHLTRPMWGERPLWSFMAQFAADYTSLDKMDGILGGTIIDNYLGYYYLSDFEQLEKQFGERQSDGTYDTSGVKLFNFNGLRQIRNNRVDSVVNEENALGREKYARMKYDKYFNFGYNYKKDANGNILDAHGNRYYTDDVGNVRVGPNKESKIVIYANGDIVDREAARGILGQAKEIDEKTKKPTQKTQWLANKDLHKLFTVQTDEDGQARFEPIKDDDGFDVKDDDGNQLWQMRTELPRKKGDEFANFLNFFQNFGPDGRKIRIVQQAIREAAATAGQEKLNPINTEYAGMIATHLVRFTGAAARNDAPLMNHKQMYDTLARFIHFRASRMKYIIDEKDKDEGKAGKHGNPETIGTFWSLVTEPMLAIATNARNEKGGWRKPILEVFHELSDARREVGKATNDKAKEAAMKHYRRIAVDDLSFNEQSERHFFDNQLERAVRISKKIRSGEALSLDKFGSWSPEVGFTFQQKEFQEAMTGFMQDLRYDVKSYGEGVQYDMVARFWDYDAGARDKDGRAKGAWRTMTLAESRYHKQVYRHKDFLTDGKPDPKKIQANQHLLYKRVFSEWIVGEINHSRKLDKMATGMRHEMAWYKNILNALEKIPGDYRISPNDMKYNEVTKQFLTKDLMKLIKKETNTTWGYLFGLAILKGVFYGKPTKKDEAVWDAFWESFFAIPKAAITMK